MNIYSEAGALRPCRVKSQTGLNTVEPILKDHPFGHKNVVSQTGGLWWQVQLYWNVSPAKNGWSFKTGSLSWPWSLKTDFTVSLHCPFCQITAHIREASFGQGDHQVYSLSTFLSLYKVCFNRWTGALCTWSKKWIYFRVWSHFPGLS